MIEEKPVKRKPRGRKIVRKDQKRKKKPVKSRKPTLIGYMRVSTEKQDHALQYDAMIEAGVSPENIYQDTMSGSKISRKGLDKCLSDLVEGDTLIVWKIDRLSRSLKDLLVQLDKLNKMNVGFISTTQQIDTTTPAGRMMMQIIGAFAEFEREMIRERVKAGIQAKRDAGEHEQWGRRPETDYSPEEIHALRAQGMKLRRIARELGISASTVSRVLNKKE